MSDLVTLIGSIMGDGIRQEWWPTSRWKSCWVFQTSKGNLTPYTISAPSANAASTTCNRTNTHLHRRRFAGNQIATANGSARRVLRWLHHSYYKKPVKIFEKLAASPELMGALKEERKRRDTLMETSFEWEDWFDGKCPAYTHEVSHSVIVVIVVHDTHIFIPFR